MSSERQRLERLAAIFGSPPDALGIGDDAAVLPGGVVLSVDTCVEGTHFHRRFGALDVLSRRAAIAALSDLAAMGADPSALLSSLIVPPDMNDDALDAIHQGMATAAAEVGIYVVGGNLAAGAQLSITTTVVGRAEAALLRTGAEVGDGIFVTGNPGDAGLGLAALLADHTSPFAEVWLRPRAHLAEGRALQGVASACIDISDGLLADLGHVCDASSVGAELDLSQVPRGVDYERVAKELGADPDALLLASGEAYVLLFTTPGDPPLGTRIGVITDSGEVRVRGRDGRVTAPSAIGFDHFG